jgi:hypothetical protein
VIDGAPGPDLFPSGPCQARSDGGYCVARSRTTITPVVDRPRSKPSQTEPSGGTMQWSSSLIVLERESLAAGHCWATLPGAPYDPSRTVATAASWRYADPLSSCFVSDSERGRPLPLRHQSAPSQESCTRPSPPRARAENKETGPPQAAEYVVVAGSAVSAPYPGSA